MFLFHRPTADDIHHYLLKQRSEPFSYSHVGATNAARLATSAICPPKFLWNQHRVELGRGELVFEHACQSIRQWRMMPQSMTTVYWPVEPQVGVEVVVGFNLGPLRTLNPCRVIYIIDDNVPSKVDSPDTDHVEHRIRRFGFGYGTLPGHAEVGEERFLVTHDLQTDLVHYELSCFSRPQHWLAKLGFPVARLIQARFRRLSGKQMQSSVAAAELTARQSAFKSTWSDPHAKMSS